MSAYDLFIVVPYRDRLEHLQLFAPALVQHLAGKQTFQLLVIEQTAGSPFNRGKLINVGFLQGRKAADHFVMHDVDMLPEDASCDYTPHPWPVHLAGCTSQYHGKLPYDSYVGGVLMLPVWHFVQLNGFSNHYWGWGREDDEMWLRIKAVDLHCDRRPGKYRSLRHPLGQHNNHNSARFVQARKGGIDFQQDGLRQTQYHVLSRRPLAAFLNQDLPPQHEILTVDLRWEGLT